MLCAFGAIRQVPKRTIVVLNKNYTSDQSKTPNVPGLSEKVVKIPDYPVGFKGSKKDAEYKNPEYFCYHVDSFADAFIEMDKYRLPAPSNKKPEL